MGPIRGVRPTPGGGGALLDARQVCDEVVMLRYSFGQPLEIASARRGTFQHAGMLTAIFWRGGGGVGYMSI